jgi:hypothetical protein
MHKQGFFDEPDATYLAHANAVNDQCMLHTKEWEIDPDRLDKVTTAVNIANAAYKANVDPSTRNAVTSAQKKAAFGELKHDLPLFVDYLESTLTVPDEALAFMHLRPRDHTKSEPKSPPDEEPVLTTVRQHGQVTAYVSLQEHGQPTRSVKRKQYHGFKLRWRFEGETTYHIEFSTRLHYTIFFEQEDATKRVELSAAWINPRLQEGPWSDVITEVVE